MSSEVGIIRVKPKPSGGGGGGGPTPELTFVAVGTKSLSPPIQSSEDGLVWTARSSTFDSGTGTAVTYGNALWVLGTSRGSGAPNIGTSTDGITWSSQASVFDGGACRGITWTGSIWIACGRNSSFEGKVAKSNDGVTWTAVAGIFGFAPAAIGWNGSLYVMFAGGFDSNAIRTSPDGDTWTVRTSALSSECYCGLWDGSKWVAGGYGGDVDCIQTSPDGINWTLRSNPFDDPAAPDGLGNSFVAGLAYNGSVYVAAGRNRDRTRIIMTSNDAITWTYRPSPLDSTSGDAQAVAWSASLGLFVVGATGTVSTVTSPDGITWTAQTDALTTVRAIAAKS